MIKLFKLGFTLTCLLIVLIVSSCSNQNETKKPSNDEIAAIIEEAYIYGYPMVLMDYTRRRMTNVSAPNIFGNAPVNEFGHASKSPDAKFTGVVKPNVDTYYSMVWYNLKKEPMILEVPATDRYYLLPHLDAFSNVFFAPGTRTTGTGAHKYLIAGPSWKGGVPEGLELINAPTNMVWLLGRTEVLSPEDGATVVKGIQDGLHVRPLSELDNPDYLAPAGKIKESDKGIVPALDVSKLSTENYINLMTKLLVDNPPAIADSTIVRKMKSIGIEAGTTFKMDDFDADLKKILHTLPAKTLDAWEKQKNTPQPGMKINDWMLATKGIGSYGTDYNFRAYIAYIGLGANLPQDAVYPVADKDSEGNILEGNKKYVIHFDKDQLPPVNGFWSLTCYNPKEFLVENSINRYAVGDRNDLTFNKDGSLDIYIQNTAPESNKIPNWLPSPKESSFNLTLRLYWPKEVVISRKWDIPAVKEYNKVN
jgi:hypothetical protein